MGREGWRSYDNDHEEYIGKNMKEGKKLERNGRETDSYV